jgi:hypothetical protein
LRRPANFEWHSASLEAFSSLLADFSAASAQSSKSTGAPRHHCACARNGVSTTQAAVAATSNADVRDAIAGDFSKVSFKTDSQHAMSADCRHYRPPCHPETGHFSGVGCEISFQDSGEPMVVRSA